MEPEPVAHGVALLGRATEITGMVRFLDDLPAGPSALILEGEPGIGKTALLREAISLARARGWTTLVSRPAEPDRMLEFAGLSDLLDGVLPEVLPALPEPQRLALEAALLRTALPPHGPIDPRALSLAVLGALRSLLSASPVLLAIDDIAWLDPATARALGFAVRRLAVDPLPLGVLVTVRVEGTQPPLPIGLDALSPGRVQWRPLAPLGPEEIAELLRTRLDVELSAPALQRVGAVARGNPLFALEIGRALGSRPPTFPEGPIPVPDTLRGAIRDRLAGLSSGVRRAMLVAAAVSTPTPALVEAGLTTLGWEASGLQEAIDRGVLEAEAGRLRFGHPLLATVVYGEASATERRTLHAALANVVADEEERARHLALAAAAPDHETAGCVEEAARGAGGRGAPEVAAQLWEQAMRLTPLGAAGDARRRIISAAECWFNAGDPERASVLLVQAVSASAAGDERADALRRLAQVRYHQKGYLEALPLFEQALADAPAETALRGAIERDLAWASLRFGEYRSAADHARHGLRLAQAHGDQAAVGEALTAVALSEAALGRGLDVEAVSRARIIEEADAGRPSPPRPSRSVGLVLKWSDDLDEARGRFHALLERATEQGDESSIPLLLSHLSELECRAGNWILARDHADAAYRAAVRTGQEPSQAAAMYARALVDAHLGRVDAATSEAEATMSLGERSGATLVTIQALSVLGFLRLSIGDPGGAHRLLARAGDLVARVGLQDPSLVRFLPDEVEVLLAVGDVEAAETRIRHLEAQGRAVGRIWASAAAGRCRGLLNGAVGRLEEATTALEGSLRLHEVLGQPFDTGRTLLALGEVLRRAKRKRAAREALGRAEEVFATLGAELWLQRARSELARAGERAAGPGGLTATERRVAELVAAGKTNKEIAAEVFLSVKSVESHLTAIYRKLGIRSRTELAVRLATAAASDPHP